jgi:hypothetical protein
MSYYILFTKLINNDHLLEIHFFIFEGFKLSFRNKYVFCIDYFHGVV